MLIYVHCVHVVMQQFIKLKLNTQSIVFKDSKEKALIIEMTDLYTKSKL